MPKITVAPPAAPATVDHEPEPDPGDWGWGTTRRVVDRVEALLRRHTDHGEKYVRAFVSRLVDLANDAAFHQTADSRAAGKFLSAWYPALRAAIEAGGGIAAVARCLADIRATEAGNQATDPDFLDLREVDSELSLVALAGDDLGPHGEALARRKAELVAKLQGKHAARIEAARAEIEAELGKQHAPSFSEVAFWSTTLDDLATHADSVPAGLERAWRRVPLAGVERAGVGAMAELVRRCDLKWD